MRPCLVEVNLQTWAQISIAIIGLLLYGFEKFSKTTPSKNIETKVKELTGCHEVEFEFEWIQHGEYVSLKNYIRADHGSIGCAESVTLTTHGDFTFVPHLIPLLERWDGPISMAIYAPGTDYKSTIDSIQYLRNCLPDSNLVRKFVTFHIYFSYNHMSNEMKTSEAVLKTPYDCNARPPYERFDRSQLYKTQHNLTYPINVGRNLARMAALTHFVFANDIELYPSPGLPRKFLQMIATSGKISNRHNPRVFPLPVFEIEAGYEVPWNKNELLRLLRMDKLVRFHESFCSKCHQIPNANEWEATNETDSLDVFHITKRTEKHRYWEPFYIGTKNDPFYDERLHWEGKKDKFPQSHAMCLLDYEFHVLNDAFLVHRPGIEIHKQNIARTKYIKENDNIYENIIIPELNQIYGKRIGC